jgi:hypothetical protein
MNDVTTNAIITPLYAGQPRITGYGRQAVPSAFTRLLDSSEPVQPRSALLPTPMDLSQKLFGDAYALRTGTVRVDKLAEQAQRQAAEFADRFRDKLAAAGISTKTPVELRVSADGRVVVGDHPQAAQIRELLANDETLAREYRTIATQSEHAASAMLATQYTRDWYAAVGDRARDAVGSRYRALFDQMSREGGSRMIIGPEGTASLALKFTQQRGRA